MCGITTKGDRGSKKAHMEQKGRENIWDSARPDDEEAGAEHMLEGERRLMCDGNRCDVQLELRMWECGQGYKAERLLLLRKKEGGGRRGIYASREEEEEDAAASGLIWKSPALMTGSGVRSAKDGRILFLWREGS